MTEATPTLESVVEKLISIIEDGLGDKLSATQKARIDGVSKVLGIVFKGIEPFIAAKIDLPTLLEAISELETAFTASEDAVEKIKQLFAGKPKEEAKPAPVAEAQAVETPLA